MAIIYKYAVLTAIPNTRRGERVNIGLVVFKNGLADVRFKHASYKLRAITGESWDDRLDTASTRLAHIFSEERDPSDALKTFQMFEPLLEPSELGWISANNDEDLEDKIDEIMKSLVGVPPRERVDSKTRINTEIAREFGKLKIIGAPDASINDGKIVRDFSIDAREGLNADFALKNGRLHITSTLDLRKQSANLGEAALKSIVLDKAGKSFPGVVRKIGVYAVDEDMKENFRPHIAMLGDYADDIYNWTDKESRQRYQKSILDALRHEGGMI